VNGGQEVACRFVVSRRNGPVLLESGEEILDDVARFINVAIEIARRLPARFGGYNGGLTGCGQRFDHALIGIERFIGHEDVSLHVGQKLVGSDQIVSLAAGQMEADRVTEGIDQRVDLGA
jgi:hypothetical protein